MRNNKGLTLIEVIVVIGIMGIVSVPLMAMMQTNTGIMKRSNDATHLNAILINTRDYVEREIRYAHEVYVVETQDEVMLKEEEEGYKNFIYIKDGELLHEVYKSASDISVDGPEDTRKIINKTMLGEEWSIDIDFRRIMKLVEMELKILNEQGSVIEQTTIAVEVLNIDSSSLIVGDGGGVIGFTTY